VFGGRVVAVQLDGLPMPKDGPPPDPAELRRRLAAGQFTLDAEVTSGAPVGEPSWIYMLRVPSGRALTLYQLGHEAGIAEPARGLDYLARPVTVTLARGMPTVAGVRVHLRVTGHWGMVHLSSTYGGVTRTVELGLSPSYGWRLISPFELGAGTGVRRFTALCIALSVLPLAYWATRARGMAPALFVAGIAGGLGGLPWLAGFPPVDRSEWLAVGLGAVAGWALQRAAAYLERRCALPSASVYSSS
jgi:hypothetical protein